MPSPGISRPDSERRIPPGLLSGLIGVVMFAGSLPFTRMAVLGMDPIWVGLGRAACAVVLAGFAVLKFDRRIPERFAWPHLFWVSTCVVIGFPLMMSLALRVLPSAHGAVILALAPLMTSILGVIRGREHVPKRFWAASAIAIAAIVGYTLRHGGGTIVRADWLLLFAVLVVSVGYAEGGFLARTIGGWRTIAWALIVSFPFLVIALAIYGLRTGFPNPAQFSLRTWIGFAYVTTISMFLGFVFYYRGLGLGGVARVSQLQLLQGPLSFFWSAFMLGEPITRDMLFVIAIVIACLAVSQKARATPSGTRAASRS